MSSLEQAKPWAGGPTGLALKPLFTSARSLRLERLRSVVLLNGSVRSRGFTAAVGRSVLDLPVAPLQSLLGLWTLQAAALADRLDLDEIVVRVLNGYASAAPAAASAANVNGGAPRVAVRLERDPAELRGTGGLLRDLCEDHDDDDLVFVASAGQILLEPLVVVAEALAATGGEVSLVAHADGTPSSAMLVRAGCLRKVPAIGFVDMKEQALPLIATEHRVTVVERNTPVGLPLRTAGDYLKAVRWYNRYRVDGILPTDPFAEECLPSFGLIEDGAVVDPGARVHDSVVLRGGYVGPGATLVRSIVCTDASVADGRLVVDQLIGAGRARPLVAAL